MYCCQVKPTDLPHSVDEEGEHEEEYCYRCLADHAVESKCRCGECCRRLILEASLEDAIIEPKIKERCSPIRDVVEQIGYLLNAKDGPCVFLDRTTNLCTIYDTRPLMCRLFDCDGQDREKMVELGILPPRPK